MRALRIEDYDQVRDLWLRTEGMDINSADESREGIRKYLERNPGMSFVEERDGKVVGVLLAGHDGRRGSLHHLAVDRAFRGQGIGRVLTEAALEALKKEGIVRAALFVYRSNGKGKDFWNRMGFTAREDLTYMDQDLIEVTAIGTPEGGA